MLQGRHGASCTHYTKMSRKSEEVPTNMEWQLPSSSASSACGHRSSSLHVHVVCLLTLGSTVHKCEQDQL